jgi:MFS family permease
LGPASPSRFVALRSRNFRLIWIGLLVSYAGSRMETVAILWQVSLLVAPDRKALALGFVGLARVLPIVIFSLVSGVAADRVDRRRLMLVTQSTMTVLAGILAWLTFHGVSGPEPIYILSALTAAAGAFDMPARQALYPNLVPREHLPNAISLNTIMFQIASVAGPGLAGIVIAFAGVGWAYIFNTLSFLVVIVALLMMRDVPPLAEPDPSQPRPGAFRAALDGLHFVFTSPMIRSTMLLDFFATFFASATTLLPIFAQDILHVGARGYGWLYAASSAGALVASLGMVRWVDEIDRRGAVLIAAICAYGLATICFGISRSFWLTFACLACSGAADAVSTVLRNVIRQLETPDEIRGRMTGVNMVFFQGGPQLGELEAGLVANWFGAPLSVVVGGLGCLAATGWVVRTTPGLRKYRREIAPGDAVSPRGRHVGRPPR